jgi:biopolymer transport protein ExbD
MRKQEEMPGVNMTAMIDIVFQLVIFFIFTVKMQETTFNADIKLSMAPHGRAVQVKDPREIMVDVDAKGRISINRTVISPQVFRNIIGKAVAEYGSTTPVVIVGDSKARHEDIKRVMDICTSVGLWKLKFMALKEKA